MDRGFIPLEKSKPELRKAFHKDSQADFTGLVKEAQSKKILAPGDPPAGTEHPWVDAWLRVDLEAISKQLPYPVLPVFVEIMNTTEAGAVQSQIVHTEKR